MTLADERERARQMATRIVSFAIGVLGVTLVLMSVILVWRGGLHLLFLAAIVFVLGAALSLVGFFFQLVPFRLDELAAEKRDYDRRTREP